MKDMLCQARVDDLTEGISAALLVLANALEAKGVLTKAEFAQHAQERMLVLQTAKQWEGRPLPSLLRFLATGLETRPAD